MSLCSPSCLSTRTFCSLNLCSIPMQNFWVDNIKHNKQSPGYILTNTWSSKWSHIFLGEDFFLHKSPYCPFFCINNLCFQEICSTLPTKFIGKKWNLHTFWDLPKYLLIAISWNLENLIYYFFLLGKNNQLTILQARLSPYASEFGVQHHNSLDVVAVLLFLGFWSIHVSSRSIFNSLPFFVLYELM